MNIFRQWIKRRRAKREQELDSLDKNIDLVSRGIAFLTDYVSPFHNFSDNYGSECRDDEARLNKLQHYKSQLHSLCEKRDMLCRKLGRV